MKTVALLLALLLLVWMADARRMKTMVRGAKNGKSRRKNIRPFGGSVQAVLIEA